MMIDTTRSHVQKFDISLLPLCQNHSLNPVIPAIMNRIMLDFGTILILFTQILSFIHINEHRAIIDKPGR